MNLVGKEVKVVASNFEVGVDDRIDRLNTTGYVLEEYCDMYIVEFTDAEWWWYAEHHLEVIE